MSPLPVSSSSLLGKFNSRRLLLDTPPPISSTRAHSNTLDSAVRNRFDPNIVMILAVLLCALVCALGLNLVVRCALRCSSRLGHAQAAARLANTGVKKKALKTFPTLAYSPGLNLPRLDSECAICLTEFAQGECVRVLPRCNHGFHVKCIDKWLTSHSSCPTCRQCLLDTCQKIVGCTRDESLDPQPIIVPLEPEGLLINYRTVY